MYAARCLKMSHAHFKRKCVCVHGKKNKEYKPVYDEKLFLSSGNIGVAYCLLYIFPQFFYKLFIT